MGYPKRVLVDGEQVVERLHPGWTRLAGPVIWFLLVCALAGTGIAFAPAGGTGRLAVLILIAVAAIVLVVWRCVGPWLRWGTTHYVLTTERVLVRRGVMRHDGRSIALGRISDIGYSQTLWERVARTGTVTIESTGEHGVEVLEDVPHADRLQATLNRLVDDDASRRARGPAY